MFNVHVRRATVGGLTLENTHPFTFGALSFGHNGTVIDYPRLGVTDARGESDSEHLFRYLVAHFDGRDTIGSLRTMVAAAVEASVFSALNFLFWTAIASTPTASGCSTSSGSRAQGR